MTFHWKSALEATKEVNSLEISGFGRFDVRLKKLANKISLYEKYQVNYEKKLEILDPNSKEYNKYKLRLETVIDEIKFLKEKLHED